MTAAGRPKKIYIIFDRCRKS